MKKLALASLAILALLLLLGLAALLYVRSALPPDDGALDVRGLRAPVNVWRDSLGVPTIRASREEDLFFAQGYLHAQERLWQMELLRRTVQGRLAELFGPGFVDTDRFLRTLGLDRAAAANEAELTPRGRRDLEAYAAGVNAWLSNPHGALPPELLALRVRPEPWTVRNSLGVEEAMALDLSTYWRSAAIARAVRRIGADRAAWLSDGYPRWGVTIVGDDTLGNAAAMPDPARPAPRRRGAGPPAGPVELTLAVPPAVPGPAAALLEGFSITRASNAWVIGGARTRSGKPILANDMHLELRAPSIWMLMGLHGPDFDVAGMTIPGTPFVIAGHNRAIAWGFTNAYVDDVDFFVERLDPADSGRYLVPGGGSAAFAVLPETVYVRGADPVTFAIRVSRHGPVLEDALTDSGTVLAVQWAAATPSRTFRAIPALNRARGWDDFAAAVRDFQDPHQNVVYADTAGHFGYIMGGRVPLRAGVARPPIAPVPGWTGRGDWVGWLPFERHPRLLDPPRGYVVTANNRQAWGATGDLISSEWEEPFRALRIRQLIRSAPGRVDADAVRRMQLDVGDAMAARYRDRAVAAARAAGRPEAADTLLAWDLRATRASHAAALFYAWFETLRGLAAADLWGDSAGWFPNDAITSLLERRSLPWRGDAGAAAFDSLASRALTVADSLVAGRAWGEINHVINAHPLASSALLEHLLGLDIGPAPRAGSPYTVNVSHLRGSRPPYTTWAGPSQRHVVDMADVDGSGGFILPTGESGLPFSPHYADQFRRWLEGRLWPIPLDERRAAARAVHRLRLEPSTTSE